MRRCLQGADENGEMPKLIYLVSEDQYFVSHRLPLAQAAKAAGYEVTVLTRCGTAVRTIREAGLTVIDFAMQRRGLSPLGLLREAWQLAAIYRGERPQLVHHVALRSVVVGALAARLAGVSAVVAALTGLGYLFTAEREGHWARRLLEKALPWILRPARVIVQNPADRALLEKLGVPRARLRLIPGSGVDVVAFRPVGRAPNPTPVVLMPSRMLWDKGVGEFVEAARALRGRGRFALAGDTDAGNPSAVPVETLRIWQQEGVIEWWGRQKDMPAVLARVDIVCLPSYREGMPKALLEAMACGLHCVTPPTRPAAATAWTMATTACWFRCEMSRR